MKIAMNENQSKEEKLFLAALAGKVSGETPFWFMRQAGRYLPEYRDLREKSGGFLEMAFDPAKAQEITMQPIRRFEMSAAILFSDILTIPYALGQNLKFIQGEGPKLDPVIQSHKDLDILSDAFLETKLEPVYKAVSCIKDSLILENYQHVALIGFAGAPWTVACYMVEGGSSKDFSNVKSFAEKDPDSFGKLIDILTKATIQYLSQQAKAGAEVLQVFDSWAGLLEEQEFQKWVIAPTQKIVEELNRLHPDVPIIGFPRGAGEKYWGYALETKVTALGLDQSVCLSEAKKLQKKLPVQGNLNPALLIKGGQKMEDGARKILETLADGPFIFNLGHGIDKHTPPENVDKLCKIIKAFKK